MRTLNRLLPLLISLAVSPLAAGQGLYGAAPDDAARPPKRLALESHTVRATVTEQLARYEVEQVFRNQTAATIEGVYLFPLPRGAVATGLSLRIGDQDVAGEILDAGTAKKTYRDIVRRMKDPALLEYVDDGLLRASIFPIGPRAEVKVSFSFATPAERVGALSSLVLPLKFAARTGARVTVDVSLSSDRSLTTIYSPTHVVDVARDGARRARVSFEGKTEQPTDFRLYFARAEGGAASASLLTHRRDGEDGTFVLMIAPPPVEEKDGDPIPRDVVFVLDRSGSMAGEKWEQATDALAHGLRTLRPFDRFAVVSFATDVRRFRSTMATADRETVKAATAHLEGLKPAGGTNIDEALTAALGTFEVGPKRLRLVAFLTDGLPTVGRTEVQEILTRACDTNAGKARLFSFGVGYDVNTLLLDRLAEDHGGATDYIETGENLEVRVSAFFEKVAAPYLTAPRIDFGDVEVFDVDPPHLPDLFHGGSLLVTGRYRGHGMKAIRVHGTRRGEAVSFAEDATWPRTNTDHAFVPALWAGRHVGTLLHQIRLHGANKELIDEVIRLGREYGVVTPYTSGLVVEEGMRLGGVAGVPGAPPPDPENGVLRWRAAEKKSRESLAELDAGDGDDEGRVAGRAAVRRAKSVGGMRDQAVAEAIRLEAGGATYERVEASGRVLFQVGGVLVDRDLTPALAKSARVIEAFSDEYFALLDAHPGLKALLAHPGDLLFVLDGAAVRVEG